MALSTDQRIILKEYIASRIQRGEDVADAVYREMLDFVSKPEAEQIRTLRQFASDTVETLRAQRAKLVQSQTDALAEVDARIARLESEAGQRG